jgi:RHH-type transcriptional regulator, proline utilization regulon repressor / proline dehydrogenase / delta 1-pyrroline-5-carboxylate dehydrogenase
MGTTFEHGHGSDMDHESDQRDQRDDAHDEQRIGAAIALARRWVADAAELESRTTRRARRRRRRLRTIVSDAHAAQFTVELTDQIPRLTERSLAGRRFGRLVATADLSGFDTVDRLALRLGGALAPHAAWLVMPLVERRLRDEASDVVLPADDPGLGRHLAMRRREGLHPNINVLGEAIVGDGEAAARLDKLIERIRRPDVDYVSVKISAICAGISTLAFEHTVDRLVERLHVVYREAAACDPPVFVNLDMEEYRDLDLTVAAFRRTLDRPDIAGLDAGIVLQAYLPDVHDVARDLGLWATQRFAASGGRTRVRLVKGANLAMEAVDAELHGWDLATHIDKAAVDANYKAVLDVLTDTAFDQAIDVGVGSHNLFDVAWALGRRAEMVAAGRRDRIGIEMLEGMAPAHSKVVSDDAGGLLLYAPVVERGDFPAALAYLVRRLDENTTPQNFLAQLFDLADDPVRFAREADRFASSVRDRHDVDHRPRRRQDRSEPPPATPVGAPFANAPDTDWTRHANRAWIAGHLQLGADHQAAASAPAPPVGPSAVDRDAVDRAVAVALEAQDDWWAVGSDGRAEILHRVGDVLERRRGIILATMVHDAAKTVAEGDPEVSEAIDFARYYAADTLRLATLRDVRPLPLGTVVVAPPWNFPLAIAAGGVLAALAAGSSVILKPAPQSVRTAALVADACWEAGVPREVLQFLPAPDGDVGRHLVTHPDVDAVVLTGAYATASMFHEWRPALRLHAETSGKNAIVVSATADIDLAVADIVRSAFGHAGQKCSAASLAIVDARLYDDARFLERLRDAAATLRVGSAADLATDVGPLIEPPGPALERALTSLDAGEAWLLEPECRSDDRRSWTPGIRTGVRPGSWFARTECFGPVLGVVRSSGLDEAIGIQNSSDYGLTAGLHSLDPDEVAHWLDRVEAGNLYVNRGITGAIVQRQPFGGWKRSSVGPTSKAGGPNYVASLMRWTDVMSTSMSRSMSMRSMSTSIEVDVEVDVDEVERRYERWMHDVGRAERDATGLRSEHNLLRFRPAQGIAFRFGPAATDRQRRLVAAAARVTGVGVLTSEAADEDDSAFVDRLVRHDVERVRLVGLDTSADDLRRACHAVFVTVDDAPPVSAPEIELPRWLREQSVTITAHRHGRIEPSPR